MVRSALIQMSTEYDKAHNVKRAAELVSEAADGGAQIVCLQEIFHTIYFPFELDPRHLDLAEPLDGPSMEVMRESAREHIDVLIIPDLRNEWGFFRDRRPDLYGDLTS